MWLYFLLILGAPLYVFLRIVAPGCPELLLGRLGVVYEQAGKARIVAITNWWIQFAFKPLHDALFNLLRELETDGTFNQEAPLDRVVDLSRQLLSRGEPGFTFHCFDLSAATDRLPIDLQADILDAMGVESIH